MENKSLMGVIVLVLVLGGGIYLLANNNNEVDNETQVSDNESMMENNDEELMMENDADSMENSDDDLMMEEGVMVGGAMMTTDNTIVENAALSADHTTLVAAVKAAGLDAALSEPGPYTVFAPTNEAFDALPEGTVDSLLLPENADQLEATLTYHVVSGEYTAADLTDGMTLTTLNGDTLTVTIDAEGNVMINDSMVVTADALASNGVVHVIDSVLLPQN